MFGNRGRTCQRIRISTRERIATFVVLALILVGCGNLPSPAAQPDTPEALVKDVIALLDDTADLIGKVNSANLLVAIESDLKKLKERGSVLSERRSQLNLTFPDLADLRVKHKRELDAARASVLAAAKREGFDEWTTDLRIEAELALKAEPMLGITDKEFDEVWEASDPRSREEWKRKAASKAPEPKSQSIKLDARPGNQADAVVMAAIEAIGGVERLSKLRAYEMHYTNQRASARVPHYVVLQVDFAANRRRHASTYAYDRSTLTMIDDGENSVTLGRDGKPVARPVPQNDDAFAPLFNHGSPMMLLGIMNNDYSREYVGEQTFDNQKVDVVRVSRHQSGNEELLFDRASRRLVAMRDGKFVTRYREFTTQDRVTYPAVIEFYDENQELQNTWKVTKHLLVESIAAEEFKFPPFVAKPIEFDF